MENKSSTEIINSTNFTKKGSTASGKVCIELFYPHGKVTRNFRNYSNVSLTELKPDDEWRVA